jgi:hypothetical protein
MGETEMISRRRGLSRILPAAQAAGLPGAQIRSIEDHDKDGAALREALETLIDGQKARAR